MEPVGTPVRSQRAAVRRDILRRLREHSSTIHMLISRWDCSRKLWGGIYAGTRPDGSTFTQFWRWRTLADYPENDPVTLRRNARLLRGEASRLLHLAVYLDEEATTAEAIREAGAS